MFVCERSLLRVVKMRKYKQNNIRVFFKTIGKTYFFQAGVGK